MTHSKSLGNLMVNHSSPLPLSKRGDAFKTLSVYTGIVLPMLRTPTFSIRR